MRFVKVFSWLDIMYSHIDLCNTFILFYIGNPSNQVLLGRNGAISLLSNFALEHIQVERVVLSLLAAMQSLVINNAFNGTVFQQAGINAVILEWLRVYVHRKNAEIITAAILAFTKALLSANEDLTYELLIREDGTKTEFVCLLVKAVQYYAVFDEIAYLSFDVISLLIQSDHNANDKRKGEPSHQRVVEPLAAIFGEYDTFEMVLSVLQKHSSALGHAQYLDQLKRHKAMSKTKSRRGSYSALYSADVSTESSLGTDFQEGFSEYDPMFSGVNYDKALMNAPEDDTYDLLFCSNASYEMSHVFLSFKDRDVFFYATENMSNKTMSEASGYVSMETALAGTSVSAQDSVSTEMSTEKFPLEMLRNHSSTILPIDIYVVQALCRALFQLCSRTPANAAKCVSLGIVKALNNAIGAVFVSSGLSPSVECIIAKDIILSSVSTEKLEAFCALKTEE